MRDSGSMVLATHSPSTLAQARRTVARSARNGEDRELLLDILGLRPSSCPQPAP